MDIKAKIEEIVKKVTSDKDLMAKFQKDPIKAVESVIGVDLPDDVIKEVTKGVQAKIGMDKLSGALGGLKNMLGK